MAHSTFVVTLAMISERQVEFIFTMDDLSGMSSERSKGGGGVRGGGGGMRGGGGGVRGAGGVRIGGGVRGGGGLGRGGGVGRGHAPGQEAAGHELGLPSDHLHHGPGGHHHHPPPGLQSEESK